MDNCKEVLEYLIELKKTKKEPNRFERDQFVEAQQKLVAEAGNSEEVDYYLFGGFRSGGGSVVKSNFKHNEDREDFL